MLFEDFSQERRAELLRFKRTGAAHSPWVTCANHPDRPGEFMRRQQLSVQPVVIQTWYVCAECAEKEGGNQ